MRPLLGVLLGACGFTPSAASSIDAPSTAIDADLGDAPALCGQWHPHDFMPCTLGTPQPEVHLDAGGSPYTYDTTTDGGVLTDKTQTVVLSSPLTVMQSDGSFLAVLSTAKLTIDSGVTWNVIGPKPLLVASWSTIDIAGTLDAGSHTTQTDGTAFIQQPTQIGAGANQNCGTLAGMAGTDGVHSGGSGGGGGGAFRGAGGGASGGDTNCTNNVGQAQTPCPRPGGTGGIALSAPPTTVRGGCPGGASGKAGDGATAPATADTLSAAGAGGGAIELAAFDAITIPGSVLAGGAAGAGCPLHTAAGGGGGGSGGLISLDSASITVTGTLAANGGGGGGSAPFTSAPAHGNPGSDGQPSAGVASGGAVSGGTCGVGGGAGGALGGLGGATVSAMDACGGGGGGGGAGFVLLWSHATPVTAGAIISPDPQTTAL